MIHTQESPEFEQAAKQFCDLFLSPDSGPRFVLGRNEYARSISQNIDIEGFIDDFSEDESFAGRPVIKSDALPLEALVVTALFAKPLLVQAKLNKMQIRNLDYFAFQKFSHLPIRTPDYPDFSAFRKDFSDRRYKYEWIYSLLEDKESEQSFEKIVNFRLTSDLGFMNGFTDRQDVQYFEPFLNLARAGEVFVDAGGYDGATTREMISRCPELDAVHFFEPIPESLKKAKAALTGLESRIHYYCVGLSDISEQLTFETSDGAQGADYRPSEDGDVTVELDALDNRVNERITFIKMDIEGSETKAINGARRIILEHHPRMAIAAYHLHDDFWKIPELVLSIRSDYKIYLRHYTEGTIETVLFFVPA